MYVVRCGKNQLYLWVGYDKRDRPLLMNLLLCVYRFPQLQFQYKDPERGFDRRAVHGPVARLITVKDPVTATALEVTAGGKVVHLSAELQSI